MKSRLDMAHEWLIHCMRDHPLCDGASPYLPSRVINLSSRAEPFLQETSGEQGDYAALSYCWGLIRNPDMMTIGPRSRGRDGAPDPKPNIERHREKIPFAAMTKTLQDSVIVCRFLGIHYLWVDAFCIVQGDNEEWEREHPRMGDIYSNAKVVIAASNADAPEQGFLGCFERLHLPIVGSGFSSEKQNVLNSETQFSRRTPTITTQSDMTSPLLLDEPLNRRAWALSEAIFSNRILHFTSTGLIWECNHARHYEGGHTRIFHELSSYGGHEDSFRVFRSHQVARTYTMNAMYRKWHSVVEYFTARQINSSPDMTYKDGLRLVALSRLARRFSQIMHEVFGHQDVYLGGIWKGDITRSLLWSVERGMLNLPQEEKNGRTPVICRRPEVPRGPSWSWVSVEGPIFFEHWVEFKQEFLILDVSLRLLDSSLAFDRVDSGELVVLGGVLHGLHARAPTNSRAQASRHYFMQVPQSTVKLDFVSDVAINASDLRHQFSCLYLGRGLRNDKKSQLSARATHVFMLLRYLDSSPGIYERAGISSFQEDADDVDHLLRLFQREQVAIV